MGATSQTPTPDTRLFHDIFDASPIGIAVENFDGQPLFVNPAFCSFLGFNEEELRTKHCVDFSPREDAEKDWALFQQLRAGSIDQYQLEKRYFRRDGSLVWGRLRISLFNSHPSPLVLAMVEDITDKKRAEEALYESEERLRLAVQAGRMFAYSWDAVTDVIERSGESAEILGVKNDQAATGAAISAMVHPDDKQRLETALAKLSVEVPTLQITYRIMRPDGAVAWLERNSRAYFDGQGKVRRIVGMIVDVTERKRAEEALSKVSQKLIEAQEQERSRLARELHDDINQRLALLSVQLNSLKPKEARKQIEDVASDIQALSHRLHSPKLDFLGLASAAAGFCRELSDKQGAEIDFRSENVPKELPQEVSLCLFRILQEALQNAIKHSGSRQFQVSLKADAHEVELTVRDSGVGFEPSEAVEGPGLGLTSMQERVKLVDGELSIDSQLQRGTTIRARVPLFIPK